MMEHADGFDRNFFAQTKAELPKSGVRDGALRFCSDGEQVSESLGSGTGCWVYADVVSGVVTWRRLADDTDVTGNPGGTGGVTDHGALTGLADDDHTQYLNTTRHAAIGSNPHGVTASDVGAPAIGTFNDHHARHENGGDDEISVAGLSGELADAQTPKTHASTHADGGTDEVAVEGLPTASTTTTHVLMPDGTGGVEFVALADGDIPSTIARDTEVTSAINAITPGDIGAPSAEAGAGSIWVQSSQPTANATGDLWVETA